MQNIETKGLTTVIKQCFGKERFGSKGIQSLLKRISEQDGNFTKPTRKNLYTVQNYDLV